MTLTRRGLFALTASAAAARKLPVVVAPVDALAPFKALVNNEIPFMSRVVTWRYDCGMIPLSEDAAAYLRCSRG